MKVFIVSIMLFSMNFIVWSEYRDIFYKKDFRVISVNDVNVTGKVSSNVYIMDYRSDFLMVKTYIIVPDIEEKMPVVMYCRGGNRDFGLITDKNVNDVFVHMSDFYKWIMVLPLYRGNSEGAGIDEFGGDDVNDLLVLRKILDNVRGSTGDFFMVGASRGGLMVYRAISEGIKINAAAVISGSVDLIYDYRNREFEFQEVLRSLIGGPPEVFRDRYIKRSAFYWSEKITAPTLIIHGANDFRVGIEPVKGFYNKLKLKNNDVKMVVYEDDHYMTQYITEAYFEIDSWFKKYR